MVTIAMNAGIRLVSGSMFDYSDPHGSDVSIKDIAAALANCCRFAGHLPFHYSVAQHALNTSRIVAPEFAFTALMHDTAEAFTNDLPTPLKFWVPQFKDLEVAIESAMAERFGFTYPLPGEVKVADSQMLQIEKVHVKKDYSVWDCLEGVESDHLLDLVDLRKRTQASVRDEFLARFYELGGIDPT